MFEAALIVMALCAGGIAVLKNNNWKRLYWAVPKMTVNKLAEKMEGFQREDYIVDDEDNNYYLYKIDPVNRLIWMKKNMRDAHILEFKFSEYIIRGMVNQSYEDRQKRMETMIKQKAIERRMENVPDLEINVSQSRLLLSIGTNSMSNEELNAYQDMLSEAQMKEMNENLKKEKEVSGTDLIEKAYETLGFERGDILDTKQIRRRYHKLASKYHPDKAQNEQQKSEMSDKFTQIQQAYETLTKNYTYEG